MGGDMQVNVITWSKFPEAVYGSLLFAKTIRTGFPTAHIRVIDNGSIPAAREMIGEAARAVGAEFVPIGEVGPHDVIRHLIFNSTAPAVICDPDLVFWGSMENIKFSGLVAGRRMKRFRCPYTKAITEPRVHTSLLFVPDPRRLAELVRQTEEQRFEANLFAPSMVPYGGRWIRFDTLAVLCAAYPTSVRCFSPAVLDLYDHLFFGNHASLITPSMDPEGRSFVEQTHRLAQEDHAKLRGMWRKQEELFARHHV